MRSRKKRVGCGSGSALGISRALFPQRTPKRMGQPFDWRSRSTLNEPYGDLSTTCSAWAEFNAVRTDPTPCCTPMSTSFDVSLARHRLNPFHLGFSGVFMLRLCVPTLANVLPFGHGFFSGVLLAAFRIPLAASSSSDCLAPLALVPSYCKAPTIGTGAFSGMSW